MRFPEADRYLYDSNPLVEVVCQMKFSRLLRIEQDPAAFQERVLEEYPQLSETSQLAAKLPPPDGQVRVDLGALLATMQASRRRAYDFTSTDGAWKVGLSDEFVALSTTRYTRWEEFRARLERILTALSDAYKINTFTRVGLRYKDVVCRSKLGLRDEAWTALLRAHLLGELVDPALEKDALHAARELILTLDFDDARVRLVHGFVLMQETEDEISYLIDADFYRETPTERKDARAILDRFNREAGRLFQWSIQKRLHEAMGPRAPVH